MTLTFSSPISQNHSDLKNQVTSLSLPMQNQKINESQISLKHVKIYHNTHKKISI